MKKVLLVLAVLILLYGCDKSESNKNVWPDSSIIEYSTGNIVSVQNNETNYVIKVDFTSKEEYLNYIEALKTISFYEEQFNDNSWYGTDDNKYIVLDYIDSTDSSYNGYNLEMIIYLNKPIDWLTNE